jgi:ATP-binding cassette, subfamily B, bacterial
MGTARLLDRLRRSKAARQAPADEETAELTANYWRAYDARMASVGLADVARRFPGLVGQAVRLGWSASRLDTAATISLNLVSLQASQYDL